MATAKNDGKRRDSNNQILPENVTQRKDGTYMWRKSVDGKQYCEYSRTLNGIKQKRNKALYEIEHGTYKGKRARVQESVELARKDITLNEWFFQWEKAYRIGKVKNNTLQHNHHTYMTRYSDTIGRKKIGDIKQIDIAMICQQMRDEGLTYTTIHRYTMLLSVMFGAAVDNGLIDSNPAQGALQIRKDDNKDERRVLTVDEQKRFLEFVQNDDYYRKYYSMFAVAFGTGMRCGELTGLTWKDIDFKKREIDINHAISHQKNYVEVSKGNISIDTPKTKSSIRKIPMIDEVYRELEYLKKHGKKSNIVINGYKDFVFVTSNGTPYINQNINKTLYQIVDKMNGIELYKAARWGGEPVLFERFSSHAFRHTFATRCLEKGIQPKVVQKLLGHASIKMTMDLYTHVTEEYTLNEIRKLEEEKPESL